MGQYIVLGLHLVVSHMLLALKMAQSAYGILTFQANRLPVCHQQMALQVDPVLHILPYPESISW